MLKTLLVSSKCQFIISSIVLLLIHWILPTSGFIFRNLRNITHFFRLPLQHIFFTLFLFKEDYILELIYQYEVHFEILYNFRKREGELESKEKVGEKFECYRWFSEDGWRKTTVSLILNVINASLYDMLSGLHLEKKFMRYFVS